MMYNKSDLWIIEQMYKTINFMASDLSDSDLNCYYCSHFPEGGDGGCSINTNGGCHFKWRYANKVEKLIEKIKNEKEQNNEK